RSAHGPVAGIAPRASRKICGRRNARGRRIFPDRRTEWFSSTCLSPLKINHEETKSTKAFSSLLRHLRFFVVDFHLYSDLIIMPTIFTHGAIGFTAMRPAFGAAPDRRLLFASILLPILPDADALLTPWIPYAHPFGHRGFTHSLFFAALVGVAAAALAVRGKWGHSFLNLAIFFAAITAMDGWVEAMSYGGVGGDGLVL